MKLTSFENLFSCLLSDIYIVENLIIKNIPNIIKHTHSDELKEVLKNHLKETKEQAKRLDKIFQLLKLKPATEEWLSDIKQIFSDAESFLKENTSSPVLDAAVIAFTQRIEHFEIATYGTLKAFADVLDYDEVGDILKHSLKEEEKADVALSELAEGGVFKKGINVRAAR
jgi:ferritin-like metal-binding protein YciE